MECPYCNAENRDGVRYCSSCGRLLQASSAALPKAGRTLLPGAKLQGGRYVIQRVLGQGGMGAALLAVDMRVDSKLVVIKELLSDAVDQAAREDDVRNFKREMATLAHIDHPLVPNVTDHFQEDTRYFLVQEYVEGENLEERLERTAQPMGEREALIAISEILDVLDYLSHQTPPIVHRDIKPANIIIGTRDRRAHLVDFGIARADETRNARRKQTTALGTPGYAPPEQYQGNADPRSDLYALAATLHHLLTNRDPRNSAPFAYPAVRLLNPQLSPEIEQFLQKALQNDVNKRFQSASAMKQEIDLILRQRFGLAGNIDSYLLGTSGAMQAIQSQPSPSQSGGYNTYNTYNQQATLPVYNQSQPVPAMAAPPPPPTFTPKKKRRIWPLLIFLAIVVVAVSVGASVLHLGANGSNKPNSTPTATIPATGLGITRLQGEPIGISDGSFAFDTTLPDGSLKAQAAQAFKQNSGDSNRVISLLNAGVEQSANDAESLIYLEDIRVANSGSPYLTLVIATMLTGDNGTITIGRDDLQGAYVAQKEYNSHSKLHNGTQVRLLIANTGSTQEGVAPVAQQIVQLSHADATFVGVMGWPYSSRTLAALKTLADAHIPLVSQTASSDLLTQASPYFFRVVPSNKVQGIAGANYAEQTLHASRVAMFSDDGDAYSQSLAQDFARKFTDDGKSIVVQEKYTVGKPQMLPGLLKDALSKEPDLIYFSGYSSDLSILLENLPAGSTLPILGGDALYELGGYPPEARSGFKHLHFTAFAYPDEWSILGYGGQQPDFFGAYAANFNANGKQSGGAYGFTRSDNDAMLSYDATVVLLNAANLAYNLGKQKITPQDLQQGLSQIKGDNTVQGVSGQIAFGSDGDPVDKAIVVLYVDDNGHIHMESALGRFLK
ncbi:protein kinase domain-containing protein [Tengunoibacter tsumagoiensis]|uniref:non-specific serine/threonine protein kinase n=1 Tax=Tengunoibacter tsumagoiensis TaxID=2014871 RepID=A0A401ZWQ8_9CHLR|nr:ABC transporter substrate-binding protein [Tengunoibacter tsumagoiensis]GCE11303.1 hypothetical protein KTT_11620 [Tengunoibacter tsumagoiensis]